MIKPRIPQSFLDSLLLIRRGLHIGWDQKTNRFFIAHEHEYTGLRRVIIYIENKDGSFRMPDQRDLNYLMRVVDWNKIDKYPSCHDLFEAMMTEKDEEKRKKLKRRNEWIKDFIKDNRRGIRQAVRNMWEGKTASPEKPKDKKIFIDSGYQKTSGGLLVPFSKD